jgi:hypothetical protein
VHRNRCAVRGEPHRDGPADPAAAAGYKGRTSGQFWHDVKISHVTSRLSSA